MTPLARLLPTAAASALLLTALALPVDALSGFSMTLDPPHVVLEGANSTARYELTISNHGNATRVVTLTDHNVTTGWTISYAPHTLVLGPHANRTVDVTFEREGNATYGEFTIRGVSGNETHEVTGSASHVPPDPSDPVSILRRYLGI